MDYQYEYIKIKSKMKRQERLLNDRINKLKAEIYDLTCKINNPYQAPQYDVQFVKLLKLVTSVTNIFADDIMGTKRDRPMVVARALFSYVARVHLNRTYTDIGRYLNRDHSTIIHLCKNYTDYIELQYQPEYDFYKLVMEHLENETSTYNEQITRLSPNV